MPATAELATLRVADPANVREAAGPIALLFASALGWVETGPLTGTFSETAGAWMANLRTNLVQIQPDAPFQAADDVWRVHASIDDRQQRDVYVGDVTLAFTIAGTRSWWHASWPFTYDPATETVLALGASSEPALVDLGPVCVTRRNKSWVALHLAGDQAAADLALDAAVAGVRKLRKFGWAPPSSGAIVVCPDDVFDASGSGQHRYTEAGFTGLGGYASRDNRMVTLPVRTTTNSDFARMITHELVHLSGPTNDGPGAPAWLEEGICELVACGATNSERPTSRRVAKELSSCNVTTWEAWDPRQTYEPYTVGYAACRALAKIHGLPAMRKLLTLTRDYGTLHNCPMPVGPGVNICQASLGIGVATLERQIRKAGDAWTPLLVRADADARARKLAFFGSAAYWKSPFAPRLLPQPAEAPAALPEEERTLIKEIVANVAARLHTPVPGDDDPQAIAR